VQLEFTPGINELEEKLYEFEQNKKNNLIFYGITNDSRSDKHEEIF